MQHKVTVRFDDELYTQIVGHRLATSDLVRESVRQFLTSKIENVGQVVGQDEINDEIYSFVYNEIYNHEIYPISLEKKYLKNSIHILENDKLFLVEQNRALSEQNRALTVITASKIPLLQRIKARLLKG